jgi:hypothetical protein
MWSIIDDKETDVDIDGGPGRIDVALDRSEGFVR